jgi:predicted O-methyltransferase YrrM
VCHALFVEGGSTDEEARQSVRRVLGRLLRAGTSVALADGATHDLFPVAMGPDEGAALASWVHRESAYRTIEIGLGYGVAALFVCLGLLEVGGSSPRHVTLDPNQATRFSGLGRQHLEEAGVSWLVECHDRPSELALPALVEAGRRFDLAVVDGNHRFDAVFVDLFYLGRLLGPGRVVFLDDYQLPGVARAAAFFVTNVGWTVEEVSTAEPDHHWAVVRTGRRPDARDFRYFVDF